MRRVGGIWSRVVLVAVSCAAGVIGLHLVHRSLLGAGAVEEALRQRIGEARALAEAARGFDPGAALAALGPHAVNGPSFRFDERLAEARIEPALESARPPGPDEADVGFEFDGRDAIELLPSRSPHRVEEGVLVLDWDSVDGLVARDLDLPIEELAEVQLRMRLERGRSFTLGWSSERLEAWPENEWDIGRFKGDVVGDGKFHVYRIDARTTLPDTLDEGRLKTLLLRPSDVPGDRVEIDYLRLVPRSAFYADRVVGRAYERRQAELRPVLYVDTPRELVYRVEVPKRSPLLGVGLSVLRRGDPVDFRVRVAAEGRVDEVLHRRVASPTRWVDAHADLSPWAGRAVEVTLSARSAGGNIAFWANPWLSGAPREPLHVIVMLDDTQRADALSAYGNPRATSPHKDRLFRSGVLFETAIAQATKTRPSCPSWMTSLYPTASGVWNFHHVLDERHLTLAEVLRSQGFATASFSQNSNAAAAAGLHQGFDQLWSQGVLGTRADGVLGDRVLRWIDAHRDRSFFLYLHVIDPHGAYDPPPPWDAWYRSDPPEPVSVEPWDSRLDPDWVETPTAEGRRLLYSGEVRYNDEVFGRFLAALEERGVLDDALLVYTSDHGEHLGEHGIWEHKPPGYRGVLQVPLWIRHPTLPAGLRVEGPVELLDVMPTVLELARIDASGLLLQGRSLLPRISGGRTRAAVSEEAMSYRERGGGRVRASVFSGNRHWLQSRPLRVFDLERDTDELSPTPTVRFDPLLRWRIRSLLAELRAANDALWREITGGVDGEVWMDPEGWEQLRALGYVE